MSYLSNSFGMNGQDADNEFRGNLQSLAQVKSKERLNPLDQSNTSTVAGSLLGGQSAMIKKSHGKFTAGHNVDSSINAE